jgi:hypothetical protein
MIHKYEKILASKQIVKDFMGSFEISHIQYSKRYKISQTVKTNSIKKASRISKGK